MRKALLPLIVMTILLSGPAVVAQTVPPVPTVPAETEPAETDTPARPADPDTTVDDDDGGLSSTAILLIVLGAVVVVLLIFAVAYSQRRPGDPGPPA